MVPKPCFADLKTVLNTVDTNIIVDPFNTCKILELTYRKKNTQTFTNIENFKSLCKESEYHMKNYIYNVKSENNKRIHCTRRKRTCYANFVEKYA